MIFKTFIEKTLFKEEYSYNTLNISLKIERIERDIICIILIIIYLLTLLLFIDYNKSMLSDDGIFIYFCGLFFCGILTTGLWISEQKVKRANKMLKNKKVRDKLDQI